MASFLYLEGWTATDVHASRDVYVAEATYDVQPDGGTAHIVPFSAGGEPGHGNVMHICTACLPLPGYNPSHLTNTQSPAAGTQWLPHAGSAVRSAPA